LTNPGNCFLCNRQITCYDNTREVWSDNTQDRLRHSLSRVSVRAVPPAPPPSPTCPCNQTQPVTITITPTLSSPQRHAPTPLNTPSITHGQPKPLHRKTTTTY
ncbi:hypothetical protein M758_2G156100, partial [Ceratodon purpureus]